MICNLFEDYLYRFLVIKMKLAVFALLFTTLLAQNIWKILVYYKYDPLTH